MDLFGQCVSWITRQAFHVSSTRSYHNRPRDPPETSGGTVNEQLPVRTPQRPDVPPHRPVEPATLARVLESLARLT